MIKIPIQLYIVWHKKFKDGEKYANFLFKNLNKDPENIRIKDVNLPVYFRNSTDNINFENAEKTIVILFIDLRAVDDLKFKKEIELFVETHKNDFSPIPITFTKRFGELNIRRLNFLRLIKEELESKIEEFGFFGEGITFEEFKLEYLLNWSSNEIAKEIYRIDEEKKSLQLFLSHTKRKTIGRDKALALKDVIHKSTQSDVFFDETSIQIGGDFEEYIKKAVSKIESIILIILTDHYSKSSWCRREVLWSKQHNKSIIIIDALETEEERSFPYMGNVKVIRLNDKKKRFSFYKIVSQIYLEAIRKQNNFLKLKNLDFNGNTIDDTPELLNFTFGIYNEKEILYPDPPLPEEELKILESTDKIFYTPTKLNMKECSLENKKIMFSISEDPEQLVLPIKTLISDLIKYLIIYKANILYGGNLTYNNPKYNLLTQMIKTLDFYKNEQIASQDGKIINYLAYPLTELITDDLREEYGSDIEVIEINPLKLENSELNKHFIDFNVWGESLTAMRESIIEDAEYIIIAGGKPTEYKGKYPGVLEEFLIASKKNKPIFILGGYGGVSKEIINLLQGTASKKLSESYQLEKNSKEYNDYYNGKVDQKFDDIQNNIISKGVSILNNGLSNEENEILFNLENSSQIIELIFKGINSLKC